MNIGNALKEILTAAAGVAAITSTVRPLKAARKDAPPFVTYQVDGGEGLKTLGGPATMQKRTVELGVYANTYAQAEQLRNALRALLDGRANTAAAAGVRFVPTRLTDETDIETANDPGKDKPVYVTVQTYSALCKPI